MMGLDICWCNGAELCCSNLIRTLIGSLLVWNRAASLRVFVLIIPETLEWNR